MVSERILGMASGNPQINGLASTWQPVHIEWLGTPSFVSCHDAAVMQRI